ncbi:MAG TPA: hypothetical protein VMU60_03685 [Syntrophobacteria bacterium]|nr:hypothetical protein [Syntrophobacteria bacterium]
MVLPEAFVGHRTPQRLRVSIPSKKGKTLYFSAVAEKLGREKALALAEVNHRTGSLLFVGDSLDLDAIADHARKEGLFDLGPSGNATPHVTRAVAAPLGNLSGQVRRFTGGHLDLPGIVFVGLLTAGVVEIARGNFGAPPWYTAFWYAFGLFSRSFFP